MPPYGSQPYVEICHTNQPLWTGEQPAPGNGGASASYPVKLPDEQASFWIEGFFDGAPGVFEIDIQASSVDADTEYVTLPGGVINAVNVNNAFRLDVVNLRVTYIRALMKTRTNAVNVFLRVCR